MKSNVFLPAFTSSLLLWSAFFPLNLGAVAYIALVPFLSLVRAEGVGNGRRYLAAWLGGWLFFLLALQWVRVAHPMMERFAWPGISLYCSLYFPAALFLLRRLDRLKLPLAFTLPMVWVALEYVRTHFPTGFPFLEYVNAQTQVGFGWYSLGYTQHGFIPLLQAADLGGVYLLSAVVACVNGIMYEWAMRLKPFLFFINKPRAWQLAIYYREMKITALGLLFAVLTLGYGTYRLIHAPFAIGPRVALLQGNISQDEKMQGVDPKTGKAAVDLEYQSLAERSAKADPKPDLVIWPETCWSESWHSDLKGGAIVPQFVRRDNSMTGTQWRQFLNEHANKSMTDVEWQEFYAGYPEKTMTVAEWQKFIAGQTLEYGTNCLLGLNTQEWDGAKWRKYNSALLIPPDAAPSPAFRYDKVHLVPFGEYVPLRKTFPWMSVFSPYKWDYSCTPGAGYPRLEFQASPRFRSGKEIAKNPDAETSKGTKYRFGVLICYEDSDPQLARRYNQWGKGGEPVDFLVNISNDGWFNGTEEHEQHLAISRFRAVETRRSLVRAVNMGISAIIDPDGRMVQLPDFEWADSKKKVAVVTGEVPLDERGSPYAFVGDWVPATCWGLLIGLHFYSRSKRTATPPVAATR